MYTGEETAGLSLKEKVPEHSMSLAMAQKVTGELLMLQAFEDAWNEACKVAASTLLVPSGSTFLVGPVSFLGWYVGVEILRE